MKSLPYRRDTCIQVMSFIRAIYAVHPHPQDHSKSHTAKSEYVGLVGCRGDLSQGSEKRSPG